MFAKNLKLLGLTLLMLAVLASLVVLTWDDQPDPTTDRLSVEGNAACLRWAQAARGGQIAISELEGIFSVAQRAEEIDIASAASDLLYGVNFAEVSGDWAVYEAAAQDMNLACFGD